MSFPRAAGVLLHPTSLPGGHGVGDLGKSAYRFVDFLAAAGQSLWQVLPLGPTGPTNSPYQSLSSFAGNPLLISLDRLVEIGLLTPPDIAGGGVASLPTAEFERAAKFKEKALRLACRHFLAGRGDKAFQKGFLEFREAEKEWVEDYALFLALKRHFQGAAWFQWPDPDLVKRRPAALQKARKEFEDSLLFHIFCQYCFFDQWTALKAYANEKHVRLIGDVPIYTAHDSADVWAEPQYFEVDEEGAVLQMAGVPPDYFSTTGQLWGNPIYRWDVLKKDGYRWWLRRIESVLKLVDILRIDHFRGLQAYWSIPQGETTAVRGEWIEAPGDDFLTTLHQTLGKLPIIAEDLGVITPEVEELRDKHGLPGMKILQFAFCDGADAYRPHTYDKNCVVYTATHDNDTTHGWYAATGPDYAHMDPATLARERDLARRYLGRDGSDIAWDFIRLALSSVADTAIYPMQDILRLGNDCRMNRPGITEGQWGWRMTEEQLTTAPAERLRELTWLYGRLPKEV